MKPQASKETVFNGRPRFVSAKRLARFAIDGARMVPNPIEVARKVNHQKHHTAEKIESRGRDFLIALRESLGDDLKTGVILHPKLPDKPYDITVEAVVDDTPKQHQTLALMHITSGAGHVTRLFVGAAQLTRAGARSPGLSEAQPQQAWVKIVDPSQPENRYDSRAYNRVEQVELGEIAEQAIGEVSTALDHGSVEVFERVA